MCSGTAPPVQVVKFGVADFIKVAASRNAAKLITCGSHVEMSCDWLRQGVPARIRESVDIEAGSIGESVILSETS